ncbi:MAG TPA: PIN domain-containing protein [Thermoanaerobaculia bacterium]|nr:PIN domain-containing protein [Thermoanaerobaculia bacterium]
MSPRHVVVDANVLLSFLVERNASQRESAKALLVSAEEGDIVAVVTQFVIFEIAYVLQSFYGTPAREIATLLRELIALPGVLLIDPCSWKTVFEYWPDQVPALADAAIVAIAVSNRYDAIATFDRKMMKKMKLIGVESYW